MSDSEVWISAENIGKKFCRSLKWSLWYGVQDIAMDIHPFTSPKHQSPSTKHKESAFISVHQRF